MSPQEEEHHTLYGLVWASASSVGLPQLVGDQFSLCLPGFPADAYRRFKVHQKTKTVTSAFSIFAFGMEFPGTISTGTLPSTATVSMEARIFPIYPSVQRNASVQSSSSSFLFFA